MLRCQPVVRPGTGKEGSRISGNPMVTDKKEDGIPEIFFRGRGLHESTIAKVRIPKGIHFRIALESIFLQRILRSLHRMKRSLVLLRDRIWPMIVRRLDDRKK